jgi:hypothetical protein
MPLAGRIGVLVMAARVPMRCCGVCTLTWYCTPFCGLSQKFGAVCPLEARETSRLLAMSRSVSDSAVARSRST